MDRDAKCSALHRTVTHKEVISHSKHLVSALLENMRALPSLRYHKLPGKNGRKRKDEKSGHILRTEIWRK